MTKGVKPLVIDSSDLLKDPPAVMEYFCNDCKVDFGEHMLEWRGGEAQEQFKVSDLLQISVLPCLICIVSRPSMQKWNGFHVSLFVSTEDI